MPERRAYTCPKCSEAGHNVRVFLGPERPGVPLCPTHRRPMVRQKNRTWTRPVVTPLRPTP